MAIGKGVRVLIRGDRYGRQTIDKVQGVDQSRDGSVGTDKSNRVSGRITRRVS